jgi:hypothetical protein
VGTTAGLDTVAKRKIPILCRKKNPDRPAHSLVAIPTELLWLLIRNVGLLNYRKGSLSNKV